MSALSLILSFPAFADEMKRTGGDGTADWSGWWIGFSVGAVGTDFENGFADHVELCSTSTHGVGSSASCSFTENGSVRVESTSISSAGGYANAFAVSQPEDFDAVAVAPFPGSAGASASVFNEKVVAASTYVQPQSGSRTSATVVGGIFDLGVSSALDINSVALGASLRRDWQFQNGVVFGIEGEASASLREEQWEASDGGVTRKLVSGSTALGSLRARLGYASGRILPYFTAGVSAGEFHAQLNDELLYEPSDSVSERSSLSVTEKRSKLAFGLVAGAGVGWMLTDRVTLGAEALYYAFDDELSFKDGQSIGIEGAWSAVVKIGVKLN